jgi:hypothetical protein
MSKATAKNWKLMAVSLSSLAVGGSLYCVRGGPESCEDRLHIAEDKIKSLANLLSQGNASEAKKALCEMQVDAGLRKICPPISAISTICKG